MHNKPGDWQERKKVEKEKERGKKKEKRSQVVWSSVGTSTATISLTKMEIKCLFDFSSVLTIKGNF